MLGLGNGLGFNRVIGVPLLLDKFSGAAAAYSLRALSSTTTDVVRVRRSSDNAEQDFSPDEITDGTLEDFVNARDVAPADYGTGAAAAYSLRYVSDSYTGDVVRVRRDSDNAEADFNPTEITDGTLLTWVGNTASDNGHVTTWYDQSGNSNDATQATASQQPKIVDSGVLVEENGKPAVSFDGTDDFMDYSETTVSNTFSGVFVGKTNDGTTEQTFYNYGVDGGGGTSTRTIHCSGVGNLGSSPTNTISVRTLIQTNNYIIGTTSTTNQILLSHFSDGISVDGYLDSTQMLDNVSNRGTADDLVTIGARSSGFFHLDGVIQEVIFYTTDQSANRENIEANVNNYYSIYTNTNDGFITTLYDQAGSNNATQTTAANQPKIVLNGSLVTDNGFECWNYDGTDDNLTATLPAITGDMLMAGTEGTDIWGVDIGAGSYNLLANASTTDYPLNLVAHIIWDRSLTTQEKTGIKDYLNNKAYSQISFGAVISFIRYWRDRTELTDFPLLDVSSGTDFSETWLNCSSLTSFPQLDVSSGTDFRNAWRDCSSLTTFPQLDVSSGTDFNQTWRDCSSLTSFPLLNVSSGTDFFAAWFNCSSLTTFPQLDVSSGTDFRNAWQDCSSLTTFPANMFDSVTATNFTNAFTSTNLSSQSIENIVVSLDVAWQSNGTLDITGGGNATTATAKTAIDNLRGRGWTVTVPDGY